MGKSSNKVLVTGGAGFIGSHLVERLISEGYEVTILDNFSTGRRENLSHIRNKKLLKIIDIDISVNVQDLRRYFKGVRWVFHLAALADIVPSITNPYIYHQANVLGTVNILEALRNIKIEKFIYIASSSCYGISKELPTSQKAPINPEYPYAFTKYIGESYALHFEKVYKLPVISLRLFNVYGPRSRTKGAYGAVFGTFLAQKLKNKPFTVVGDGTQKRDFIFVKDVVEAILLAAKSKYSGEIFNIGSGKPESINHLIDLIGGDKTYIPKRPGEPDVTWADISKAKKLLGWKPKISFEEGVKIMLQNINYYKDAPLWTKESIKKETKDWFKYLS